MKIEIKNPTIIRLNKIMKDYAKLYKGVELKYNFKSKVAVLKLTGRKKLKC